MPREPSLPRLGGEAGHRASESRQGRLGHPRRGKGDSGIRVTARGTRASESRQGGLGRPNGGEGGGDSAADGAAERRGRFVAGLADSGPVSAAKSRRNHCRWCCCFYDLAAGTRRSGGQISRPWRRHCDLRVCARVESGARRPGRRAESRPTGEVGQPEVGHQTKITALYYIHATFTWSNVH